LSNPDLFRPGCTIAFVKAVIVEVSPAQLARRKLTGEDRWDEMWEGVLHMSPAPALEHQRMVDRLLFFLMALLEKTGRGVIVSGINVFRADSDYRIPDLTFVASGREGILAEDGARGGPDAVIEVRSPGDETYEKLPFYAALGVREVIVVPRDGKMPEIHRLEGGAYQATAAGPDGLFTSEALGVRFGHEPGPPPRLVVEEAADGTNRVLI
jgi:Uma2 family endonuclease